MLGVMRRIEKLEQRTGAGQRIQLVVMNAGATFALGLDRCSEILDQTGYAPKGAVTVVDFSHIPHNLSARDLEEYLRDHAEEICNLARYDLTWGESEEILHEAWNDARHAI